MKKLTKYELDQLTKILEKFEWQECCNTGMKSINGGYAEAKMYDYDEDKVDIELEWGEQDMGGGSSVNHKENYTLPRNTIRSSKLTLEEKVLEVK